MKLYEVVVCRPDTDVVTVSVESLDEAKSLVAARAESEPKPYRIFVRQYQRDRDGFERYRILRSLTRREDTK
jgi:hypothetical protein